jgi:hypothetical protein
MSKTDRRGGSSSGFIVSNASAASPSVGSQRSIGGGFWNRICCCGSRCCCCCCGLRNRHFSNGCMCCYRPERSRPKWLHYIYLFTKSMVWKILYVFFSLFLLFGTPIQELSVGHTGDIVFGIIRNIMLAFFVIDMSIRCVTDKEYFVCTMRGGSTSSATPTSPTLAGSNAAASGGNRHSVNYMDAKEMHTPCTIGSFLFWCDLISTVAILYDLQYVNSNAYGIREIDIGLDDNGMPVSGLKFAQNSCAKGLMR